MKIYVVHKINESKNFRVIGCFQEQKTESDYLSCIVHILNNEFGRYKIVKTYDNPFSLDVECQEYLHKVSISDFETVNP